MSFCQVFEPYSKIDTSTPEKGLWAFENNNYPLIGRHKLNHKICVQTMLVTHNSKNV